MLNIKKKLIRTIGMNQLFLPGPVALHEVHSKH